MNPNVARADQPFLEILKRKVSKGQLDAGLAIDRAYLRGSGHRAQKAEGKLSKAMAVDYWVRYPLQVVVQANERDGITDWPARRESWNNYTDRLHRQGRITKRQVDNWVPPKEARGPAR